jgi:peptidoglycan hydrolase-like protein with peptidoglycan-binding domain
VSDRKGSDIVDVARTRRGQRYVLGAKVPKDNPNWMGPWDCAEYASWCAYQAYQIPFGMRPARADKGDAYSGYWYDDAQEPGVAIAWREALNIPGAILVRRPRSQAIGHVSISLGDGTHTIEARGARFGVEIFDGAENRPWDIGVLLPGVEYQGGAGGTPVVIDPNFVPPPLKVPPGFFAVQSPHLSGPPVLAIQEALKSKGYDPGPLDGDFGPMTHAAVVSFQAAEGLELDGIIGPRSAQALGLAFPIAPSPANVAAANTLQSEEATVVDPPDQPAAAAGVRTILRFIKDGAKHSVEFSDGTKFYVGTEVPYSDDMHRRGLYQDRNLSAIRNIGMYAPADYVPKHGKWAFFIRPTIKGESSGYFGRLNSYDRAAFTFGATQLAAHTPNENLILLFRRLLALPAAPNFFPELFLSGGKVTLRLTGGGTRNLEQAVLFTRPNGRQETQLRNFMDYLNSDPVKVDTAELTAAARLMLWTKEDKTARDAQIDLLVARAKDLVQSAKAQIPIFTGADWRIALWIVDIRYQSRGSIEAIKVALRTSDPLGALSEIGGSYRDRRKTVKDDIAALQADGVLNGFTV